MTLEKLIDLQGRLTETFPRLDPKTIQHAYEIMNDRRGHKEIRRYWFLTADSALYTVEDGQPILYFGDRTHNLIFKNVGEATSQLKKNNQNYKTSKEDAQSVINSAKSGNTLRINLYDLALKTNSSDFGMLIINTYNYNSLNKVQRQFAERICGQGKDFIENMKMLKREGNIGIMQISVLTPDYVIENAKENPIARLCWLNNFDGSSSFNATSWNLKNATNWIRGAASYHAKKQ